MSRTRAWPRVSLGAAGALLIACTAAPPAPTTHGVGVTPRTATTGVPTSTLAPGVPELGGPTGPTTSARVIRVVDGDTIIVRLHGQRERVRYIGVNAPETVKPGTSVEWMGSEASDANRRLVEGTSVTLEKDVSEVDQYGRLLRDVWLQRQGTWVLVDAELVRLGVAQVSTFPPDVKYAGYLLATQRNAQAQGVGLWAATPAPGP